MPGKDRQLAQRYALLKALSPVKSHCLTKKLRNGSVLRGCGLAKSPIVRLRHEYRYCLHISIDIKTTYKLPCRLFMGKNFTWLDREIIMSSARRLLRL